MPFYKGQRVSNEKWTLLTSGPATDWMEATGYKYGDDTALPVSRMDDPESVEEPTAPPKKRRTRGKKSQAEAALLAVTGLTIDLDESDASLIDTSGITDLDV